MLQIALIVGLFIISVAAVLIYNRAVRQRRYDRLAQSGAALQISWQAGEEAALRQTLDSFETIRLKRHFPRGYGQGARGGRPFHLIAYDFGQVNTVEEMLLLLVETPQGCIPFRFDRARPMLDSGAQVDVLSPYPNLRGRYRLDGISPEALGTLLPYLDELVRQGVRPVLECNGRQLLYGDEVRTSQISTERVQALIEQGFHAAELLGEPPR